MGKSLGKRGCSFQENLGCDCCRGVGSLGMGGLGMMLDRLIISQRGLEVRTLDRRLALEPEVVV